MSVRDKLKDRIKTLETQVDPAHCEEVQAANQILAELQTQVVTKKRERDDAIQRFKKKIKIESTRLDVCNVLNVILHSFTRQDRNNSVVFVLKEDELDEDHPIERLIKDMGWTAASAKLKLYCRSTDPIGCLREYGGGWEFSSADIECRCNDLLRSVSADDVTPIGMTFEQTLEDLADNGDVECDDIDHKSRYGNGCASTYCTLVAWFGTSSVAFAKEKLEPWILAHIAEQEQQLQQDQIVPHVPLVE